MCGDLVYKIELTGEARHLGRSRGIYHGLNLFADENWVSVPANSRREASPTVARGSGTSVLENGDCLVVVVYKNPINTLIAWLIAYRVNRLHRLKA